MRHSDRFSSFIHIVHPFLENREDVLRVLIDMLFHKDPSVPILMHCTNGHPLLFQMIERYGGKASFLKAYQRSVSDILLTSNEAENDLGRVQRALDGLDASLKKTTAIMLRDMRVSQQLVLQSDSPHQCRILSETFWPSISFHGRSSLFDNLFDDLERSYKAKYPHRHLVWSFTSGLVHLDIDCQGVVASFAVRPIDAIVIQRFENKSEWLIESLISVLGIEKRLVDSAVKYWHEQQILVISGDKVYIRDQSAGNESLDLDEKSVIEITPQLKMGMNVLKAIIKTRPRSQKAEIDSALAKSPISGQLKHTTEELLDALIQEGMVVVEKGLYRVK